jgi:hypothetical protein
MMPRQSGDATAAAKDAAPTRKEPRNTKRTGELSEAAFLHKAVSLGLKVTKPWGDSERYDFVLDSGQRLWRVQIKCTTTPMATGYRIQATHAVYGKSGTAYTAADIDVVAAHIVPLDLWYVVPVQALAGYTAFNFYPDGACKLPHFEKYREAWDLFRDGEGTEVARAEGDPAGTAEDGGLVEEPAAQLAPGWRPVWKPRIFGMR